MPTPSAVESATDERTPHDPGRTRWLALGAIAFAQLMVILDATVVNIALPSMQADLGFSDAARQWVVTTYVVAFGGLLMLGGRLADMWDRRRLFLIGLVGFALASGVGEPRRASQSSWWPGWGRAYSPPC